MRYRVTFMERTNAAGEPVETPPDYVAIDVPDHVVDGREDEFLAAVKDSQLAMECVPLGDEDRSAA